MHFGDCFPIKELPVAKDKTEENKWKPPPPRIGDGYPNPETMLAGKAIINRPPPATEPGLELRRLTPGETRIRRSRSDVVKSIEEGLD